MLLRPEDEKGLLQKSYFYWKNSEKVTLKLIFLGQMIEYASEFERKMRAIIYCLFETRFFLSVFFFVIFLVLKIFKSRPQFEF